MEYTGLTFTEVSERLKRVGQNIIQEKKQHRIATMARWFVSPISLMLIGASALSYVSHKLFDANFILILLLLNFFITFWQEYKADKAIEKIKTHLVTSTRVLRDGAWKTIMSVDLVPDDVIMLGGGNMVPADAMLVQVKNITLNDAALTGESMPQEKKAGDTVYGGAFVVTGTAVARVTATGSQTYFGKTLLAVEDGHHQSLLEKDILSIAKFLSFLSIGAVLLLTLAFAFEHAPFIDTLTLDLSLLIAGVPISLPTVMTLIISFGVLGLAKKNVVVRRVSSLEDLANVNLLLTDKTGTLTVNRITVQRIVTYGVPETDVVRYAYATALSDEASDINKAIIELAAHKGIGRDAVRVIEVTPADSERKRASVVAEIGGARIMISVGAPQVVGGLCTLSADEAEKQNADVEKAASEGYRSLAVAVNAVDATEHAMTLVGALWLSDTLRADAKEMISFLRGNGVEVRMLTGDHRAIGERVAEELGLSREAVYAGILPADKYHLVEEARTNYVVAVTGDGVNDVPALKEADVGIAVSNAVDALKSAADIVLLSPGIIVIRDAIIEARRIFHRLYSYSVYRISESFRVIVTIVLLGLFYRVYPLSPIQLILLALLNDVPIISLAFNRVQSASQPATINARARLRLSLLYGLVGVLNSFLFFYLATAVFHLAWGAVQTLFFLKLAISGHMLIYVAHTEERWYKFLPSKTVIGATVGTQLLATVLALLGFFMDKVSWQWVVWVWVWALFWMQVSEVMKDVRKHIF